MLASPAAASTATSTMRLLALHCARSSSS
ncbi:hypothetical protein LEMLEM_LOCUS18580 [Lemmus lemmus]